MLVRVRYTPESPPGVAFQRDTIFISLIILGHPGSNMGVFMEPLWDELISALRKVYGHTTELKGQPSKCTFGTSTLFMTSWRIGCSQPGVFMESCNAQYARNV
jgi:hypothetical protein